MEKSDFYGHRLSDDLVWFLEEINEQIGHITNLKDRLSRKEFILTKEEYNLIQKIIRGISDYCSCLIRMCNQHLDGTEEDIEVNKKPFYFLPGSIGEESIIVHLNNVNTDINFWRLNGKQRLNSEKQIRIDNISSLSEKISTDVKVFFKMYKELIETD